MQPKEEFKPDMQDGVDFVPDTEDEDLLIIDLNGIPPKDTLIDEREFQQPHLLERLYHTGRLFAQDLVVARETADSDGARAGWTATCKAILDVLNDPDVQGLVQFGQELARRGIELAEERIEETIGQLLLRYQTRVDRRRLLRQRTREWRENRVNDLQPRSAHRVIVLEDDEQQSMVLRDRVKRRQEGPFLVAVEDQVWGEQADEAEAEPNAFERENFESYISDTDLSISGIFTDPERD
jgi:hypothetical protein